jgi:6-phosphogluconolactonase/glucosamine-6-phosphate isomerase/deaminase
MLEENGMLKVFKTDEALGIHIAERIARIIAQKPEALVCIAAGTSSIPAFDALLDRVRAKSLSFSGAAFIAMDEWLGYSITDEGSMGDFLRRNFLNEAGFGETFLFCGDAPDPAQECQRAEAYIAKHGGIDYILFGIGANGHIALNEPGTDPSLRTHITKVSPTTARVGQKYFGGKPAELTQGITLGIANAMEAGEVDLTANSCDKTAVVRSILESAPNPGIPATMLKRRPEFSLYITEKVLCV